MDPRSESAQASERLARVGTLRPADAAIEGYAWLPRMLDKARAELAGVRTGFPFGCPVDHTCMARLGIGPGLVRELVARHGVDDASILAELHLHGIPAAGEAWFDAPALEHALQSSGPYLRVRAAGQLPDDKGAGGRAFVGEQHGAGGSLVLIDAPPGYRQQPHLHPTEELVAIHAGNATIHLGEVQARTVLAGEIVRIPAQVVHWVENRGGEPLRAAAAYATPTIPTCYTQQPDQP